MAFQPAGLELGLGLVSIGRTWGVANTAVPTNEDASALLQTAVEGGIRTFDTAPAYGVSEKRLGAFLKTLTPAARDGLIIMTKAGEHWDAEASAAFTDHGYDAMARSLDRSLALLGRIDVLQLHKATEDAIAAPDTARFFAHACSLGIKICGASVTSVEAGRLALRTGLFSCLQFPMNAENLDKISLIEALETAKGFPILNRPFAMGAAVHGVNEKAAAAIAAFRFLRERVQRGIVLTGTGKTAHLRENMTSFAGSI